MFSQTVLRRSKFSIEPPSSNTERTLMHLLLFIKSPNRTGFNMYTKYTKQQLTFLALHSLLLVINMLLFKLLENRLIKNFGKIQFPCTSFLGLTWSFIKEPPQVKSRSPSEVLLNKVTCQVSSGSIDGIPHA